MFKKTTLLSIVCTLFGFLAMSQETSSTTQPTQPAATQKAEEVAPGNAFLRTLPIITDKTNALLIADLEKIYKHPFAAKLQSGGKATAELMMLHKITSYFSIPRKEIKSIYVSADLSPYDGQSYHSADYIVMVNVNRPYSAEDYYAMAAKLGSRDGEYNGSQPESKKWGKTYGLTLNGKNKKLFITLINGNETILISNKEIFIRKALNQYKKGDLEQLPTEALKQFAVMLNPELPFGYMFNFSDSVRSEFEAQNRKLAPSFGDDGKTAFTYSKWEELQNVKTILFTASFPKDSISGEVLVEYTNENGPVQFAQRISRLKKFFENDRTLPANDANFVKSLRCLKMTRFEDNPSVLRLAVVAKAPHMHALVTTCENVPELQAKVDIGKAQKRFQEDTYEIPAVANDNGRTNPFKGKSSGSAAMGFGKKARK